jgi:hypothetical protein
MGYSKIVNKGNGKVVIVHQLDQDGKAYAEDVTVEVQAGVPESRVDYLAKQDGKVGTVSVNFTAQEGDFSNLKFPDEA